MSDMKKLMESLAAINECPPGMDEGGMPPMASLPAPEDKGNPVTMNVSLNASGKEHVADLINMMKNAGMDGAKEVGPTDMPAMPMRMDMERLRDIVDGPKMDEPKMKLPAPEDEDMGEGRYDGPNSSCCDAPIKNYENGMGICSDCGDHASPHEDEEDVDEDAMEDKKSKILDWVKKYETNIGNNGDALPEGYLEYMLSSGIFSDAYDQDETAKAEKMIGKPYTEWDYDDQKKALDMMPITSAMFDEIEQITGTRGEDAAEMVDDVLNKQDEGYANEPDPEYGDLSDAIPDGDDLHKRKKSFKATAGGDNPMNTESIKAQLMAALQEKKGKPDFLDLDKDGNKKEPMKKAAKDAGKDSKGSKPKKGEVPPQFKKK